MGLKRDNVRLINCVDCRPPNNRVPEKDEIAICSGFMFRQILVIKPKVIIPLGATAYNTLMKEKASISSVRGKWSLWNNFKVFPMYHPAFILRSPDMERFLISDLQKVKEYLDNL